MKNIEDRLETRHIRDLRKEIIKLKRENAQLRKKNMRLESELTYACFDSDDDLQVCVDSSTEKHKERFTCPSCGSYDVYLFTVGLFDFYNCESCRAKGRRNVSEKKCC